MTFCVQFLDRFPSQWYNLALSGDAANYSMPPVMTCKCYTKHDRVVGTWFCTTEWAKPILKVFCV